MAYIETEVIIKHATNPAGMGIILRGIDAGARAPRARASSARCRRGRSTTSSTPSRSRPTTPICCATLDAAGDGSPAPPPSKAGREPEPPDARPRAPRRAAAVSRASCSATSCTQHTLRVFVGSDVDVACPMCGVGPTGPMPKLKPFRVAGHFYTGMYEFDSKLAYVSLRRRAEVPGHAGRGDRDRDPDRHARGARATWPTRSRGASGPATRSAPGRS